MDILIKLKQNRRRIVSFFLLFAVPIIIFYLMEFYTHNPFETMLPGIQCLNIIFFELVMALGLFIFKKGRIALWVEAVIFAIVGLVNYFVLDFRSAPVMPWDILSVKTAASVADNYNYRLDKQAAIVLALFALVLLISSYCDISVICNMPGSFCFHFPFVKVCGFHICNVKHSCKPAACKSIVHVIATALY